MTQEQIPVIGTVFHTQLGWVSVGWSDEKVCQVSFGHRNKAQALRRLQCESTAINHLTTTQQLLVSRIEDYAAGADEDFRDIPIDLGQLTQFQQRVYSHCRRIPRGQTASYKTLASKAGSPKAARAVGNAMAANPIPLIVPCHRVVPSSGSGLGKFSAPGGQSMKKRLLDLEKGDILAP